MTVKIHVFTRRRPDLSFAEYRTYYESKHVPLIRGMLGDAFPLAYIRNYIPRSTDGANQDHTVDFLAGTGNLDFDCIAESTFRDRAHLDAAMAKLSAPGNKEAREADEDMFSDRAAQRIVIVDAVASFPRGEDSMVVDGK